jgi:hypothetical protein
MPSSSLSDSNSEAECGVEIVGNVTGSVKRKLVGLIIIFLPKFKLISNYYLEYYIVVEKIWILN